MLASPKSIKSLRPPNSTEFTLDDGGAVRHLIRQAATPDDLHSLDEGALLSAILHPGDLEFYEYTRAFFATRRRDAVTIRLRLRRLPNTWWQALATFANPSGGAPSVLLVPDDLSAALREEVKMRWIIEGSAQGVIVRTNTALIYANENMARLLGYASLADMNRQHTNDIDSAIHPDDLARLHAATRERLKTHGQVSQHQFRYRQKDGTYTWLEAISRFTTWNGVPAETSWINDISERVRIAEELIASRDAAQYANRTKSEFLANMSHELRTPLNAIIGFSEFIKREMGGPIGSKKYAEYVSDIYDSGTHLLSIINDILDLARLETGRVDLNEADICVPALVAASVALMRQRAEEAGIALILDAAPDLPLLRADERAVKQVLFNFISNAIKFTPESGQVTVCLENAPDGGLDLVVRDTGIGMSKSEIALALAPFGQVDSSLAQKHQGTGLGFPICDSLMRLHGGTIRVESAPGLGTSMIASFPGERVLRQPAG